MRDVHGEGSLSEGLQEANEEADPEAGRSSKESKGFEGKSFLAIAEAIGGNASALDMKNQLATKIRNLRKDILNLSVEDLAVLLGVHYTTVYSWEEGLHPPTPCMQDLLIYLEERPEEALTLLSQKAEFGPVSGEMIASLMRQLGLRTREFSALLNVSGRTVQEWVSDRKPPEACQQIILWILTKFAGRDPNEWPSILRRLSSPTIDVITPERVTALRKSFGVTQREFSRLLRISFSAISGWERGSQEPGWCANLFLRLLENTPGPTSDLMEQQPEVGWELTQDTARQIRENIGLSQENLARLLGVDENVIHEIENKTAERQAMGCVRLLYQLLESFPKETVSLIQALPKARFILVE